MSTVSVYSLTSEEMISFLDGVYIDTLNGLLLFGVINAEQYTEAQNYMLAMLKPGVLDRVLKLLGVNIKTSGVVVKLVKVREK